MAKRAAAVDEAEDRSAAKGNAVAAIRQAVCTGERDLRALTGVLPAPSPPVGYTAVSLTEEHNDAALQVTAWQKASGQ